MPPADFYRAVATAKFIRGELMNERDAHNAMKLCFEKIHKSLDMYKGHFINRIRFHLNRHHTEYLRKVRVMRKERSETTESMSSGRRSTRVGIAHELALEVETLKNSLRCRDLEIERLAMLLDEKNDPPPSSNKSPKKQQRIEKLMNPYMPSDEEEAA